MNKGRTRLTQYKYLMRIINTGLVLGLAFLTFNLVVSFLEKRRYEHSQVRLQSIQKELTQLQYDNRVLQSKTAKFVGQENFENSPVWYDEFLEKFFAPYRDSLKISHVQAMTNGNYIWKYDIAGSLSESLAMLHAILLDNTLNQNAIADLSLVRKKDAMHISFMIVNYPKKFRENVASKNQNEFSMVDLDLLIDNRVTEKEIIRLFLSAQEFSMLERKESVRGPIAKKLWAKPKETSDSASASLAPVELLHASWMRYIGKVKMSGEERFVFRDTWSKKSVIMKIGKNIEGYEMLTFSKKEIIFIYENKKYSIST